MIANVAQMLASGKEPTRIVCFGDSITGVYYHTGGRRAYADMLAIALQRIYPQARIEMFNAGISGNATGQGLARIEKDVLARKPHLVVVMFGMNDCTGANLPAFRDNLKTIVTRCREAGAAVVLCTPNSVYAEDPRRPTQRLADYAQAVRDVAAETSSGLADCYRAYEDVRAANPVEWKLLMSETIHPGMNGHRLFAEVIAEAISGKRIRLGEVPPPSPALPFTFGHLDARRPVRVIAMPPYDGFIAQALRQAYPNATIDVTPWPVDGKSLHEIEEEGKTIRAKKPTLVIVAVPAAAQAPDEEAFIRSYNWVLNWGLAFGRQEWDMVAILPSVTTPGLVPADVERERLARRVIVGRDIPFVERAAGDAATAEALFTHWIEEQRKAGSPKK